MSPVRGNIGYGALRKLPPVCRAIALCLAILPATPAVAQRPPATKAQAKPSSESGLLGKLGSLFDDLGPVPSGTGVIVFEPVSIGPDESLRSFAAGCSRWLQLIVGGQPEIGKTPTWASIGATSRDQGFTTMALARQAATFVARPLGVTHIVVGEAKSTGTGVDLVYSVYPLGQSQPVVTVNLSGSDSAIADALPGAAARIAGALGVGHPRVPPACLTGPAGLRLIGRLPWVAVGTSAEDVWTLDELAPRDPLAAMYTLFASTGTARPGIAAARQNLTRMAPENAIAQHTLAAGDAVTSKAVPPELRKMSDAFPGNYLLNASLLRYADIMADYPEKIRLARRSVQISSNNAHAWNRLATAYSDFAANVRRGRLAANITKDEWDKLESAYTMWAAAAKRAVDLDPKSADYWRDLSTAACFAGLEEAADQAYWKAISLNPSHYRSLSWGLEMFQPKWLGMPQKLARVVGLCVNANYASKSEGVAIAQHIAAVGKEYKPDSDKLLSRMAAEAKEVLAKDSTNLDANTAIARMNATPGTGVEATRYLLNVARQRPDDEPTLLRLSWVVDTAAEATEVDTLIRNAIAKHPDNAGLRLALGRTRFRQKDYAGAIEAFKAVPAGAKERGEADQWIGFALRDSGRTAEMVDHYRAMVQRSPQSEAAHIQLISGLRDAGRMDEALEAARKAKALFPNSKSVHQYLAEILEKSKDYAGAAVVQRYLVAREENKTSRAFAEVSLGQNLARSNQRDEAIKAFKAAIEDGPDTPAAGIARAQLQGLRADSAEPPSRTFASAADVLRSVRSLPDDNGRKEKIAILKDAIEKWPGDAGLLLELGQCLLWEKQVEPAETILRDAVKADPKSVDARLRLAQSVSMQRRGNEAVLLYQEALKLDPKNRLALNDLVEHLIALNRYEEAADVCKQALDADPGNAGIRSRHAMLLINLGDYEGAIAAYRAVLQVATDKTERAGYRSSVGAALMALSRRDEAIKEWKLALAEDPSGPFAAGAKRSISDPEASTPGRRTHRPSGSRAAGSSPVTSVPTATTPPPNAISSAPVKAPQPVAVPVEARNLLDKADELRKTGKLAESIEVYQSALKVEPRFPQARFGLGMALMFTGKAQEACAELRRAAEAMPADAAAQHYYGVSLMAVGNSKEALPWLRRAAELDPANLNMQDTYVNALLSSNMSDEAMAAARTAKSRVSSYLLFHERVGRAYEMKGDPSKSLAEYRLGVAQAADKYGAAVFHVAIGKLLLKMGNKSEARKELELASEADPPGFRSEARILLDGLK